MIDVSELMFDPDFVQPNPVDVWRGRGAFADDENGLYNRLDSAEHLAMTMIVQRMNPSQLMALPEGERLRETIACWSNAPLLEADGVTDQQADLIVWKTKPYRVISAQDRSDNGFYRAIAQYSPEAVAAFTRLKKAKTKA